MSLFRVVSVASGTVIQAGFVNKMDAKASRDELNKPFNTERKTDDPFRLFNFIVMRDRGHRLGASPIPKNIRTLYNKPIPVRVTDTTTKFYQEQKKEKVPIL